MGFDEKNKMMVLDENFQEVFYKLDRVKHFFYYADDMINRVKK